MNAHLPHEMSPALAQSFARIFSHIDALAQPSPQAVAAIVGHDEGMAEALERLLGDCPLWRSYLSR